mgnify:CR=1 FL=1
MMTMGPVIEIIADPRATVDAGVDLLDGAGTRRPSGWFQHLTGLASPVQRSEFGVPEYARRSCCYTHLRSFDGRFGTTLDLPFTTTCLRCGRTFRVTLGVVGA